MLDEGREDVRQTDLKSVLQLDKSAVSRRVAEAVDAEFLRNLEDRKGGLRGSLLEMHCPITARFSPHPEQLFGDEGLRSCTVDPGDKPPPPGAEHKGNLLEAKRRVVWDFPIGSAAMSAAKALKAAPAAMGIKNEDSVNANRP